jgi:hypothetical protein
MLRDWTEDANSLIELASILLAVAASESLIKLRMTTIESVDDAGWLTEAALTRIELGARNSMTDSDADTDDDLITMLLESFTLLLRFAELLAFTLLAFELLGRTLVFRLELSFLEDDTAPLHFPNALLQPFPQYALELPHPRPVLEWQTSTYQAGNLTIILRAATTSGAS